MKLQWLAALASSEYEWHAQSSTLMAAGNDEITACLVRSHTSKTN